jgi:hypothetical protein
LNRIGRESGWRARWRESAGAESANGGTVQSDQRRGASETGTVPTARVRHKEPFAGFRRCVLSFALDSF